MVNILEVNPSSSHASSFYRARLPLARLQQQYPQEIALYPYHNGPVGWDFMILFSLVFIQRPYSTHHMNVIKAAKKHRLPVWLDYDDLLSSIPTSNPACEAYDDKAIQLIGEMCDQADVVTCSTLDLKLNFEERYGITDPNKFVVIPNAWCLDFFPKTPVFRDNKFCLQRGSSTHINDLLEFSEPIIEVMNNNPDWSIDFIGYNPFFITNKLKKSNYTKGMPIDMYLDILPDLDYSICIVPLHDNPFNHSKSNIAFLESTYAGAVCLAPSFMEWQRPGIINYTNKEDFGKKLKAMMDGEYDLKDLHSKAWNYIQSELSLTKVNELRWNVIKRLLKQQ